MIKIYFVTYFITAALSLYRKNIYIIYIYFLLVYGILYKVGQDYINYHLLYENLTFLNIEELKKGYEVGFLIFTYIHKILFNDVYTFYFLIQVLVLGILFYYLKRWCIYPYLGLNIYFSRFFFSLNIDQQRQCIALFIFLIGFHFLEKNKLFKFYICCVIASCFHISAVICFFIPIFLKIKIDKKIILAVYFLGTLINFLEIEYFKYFLKILKNISFSEFLNNKIQIYINSEIDQQIKFFTLGRIERGILFAISIWGLSKYEFLEKKEKNYFKLYFCYAIMQLYFYEFAILIQRFGYFFRIFEIFLFPNIIYNLNRKINKIFLLIIILMLNFFSLINLLVLNKNTKEAFMPYQNFILNKKILKNANEKLEFEFKLKKIIENNN